MKQLSERQAYAAMYAFLQDVLDNTGHDFIATLLGGLSLLPDGATADPAVEHEWRRAVERALAGEVNLNLDLK